MGIRLKILLAFVLCFGVMGAISLSLLQGSMNESYDAIERSDIAANMARVEQSFEASAASLRNQTNDWAVWNEMYRYVLKPDADWASENLGEGNLAPANLSLIMVFAKQGDLLSSASVSHEGKNLNLLDAQATRYLEFMRKDGPQGQCGIIKIDAGLMQVCWAGIVQMDIAGDAVGTVLMGRFLDSPRLSKLREQTRLSFDLAPKTEMPDGLQRWSGMLSPGSMGTGEFWAASDPDLYHLYYPVQDILGQNVGLISLDVPRSVHQQGLQLYLQVRRQLGWTALFVTALLGLALHFILIRRLRLFAKQIDILEENSTWKTRIEIGGDDELGLVAQNFNKLLVVIRSQVEGLRDLIRAKETALKVVQATQTQLIESEKVALLGQQRVRNLLNNSGQGFLSFGRDLVIDPEVSRACESMLGCSPAGGDLASVLFSADGAKAELLREIIPAVLDEPDETVRESMLSLLPAEIQRDDVLLKVEYRPLENERFMVVLTDMTEERRLAALLESERLRLELIVTAVSDTRNFFDAIDAFRDFLTHELPRLLGETAAPTLIAQTLYREIHTYKGVLNQFCFIHVPKALHAGETRLSGLLLLGDSLTRQQLAESVSPPLLQAAFEDDLAILAGALGKEFLENGENIFLSADQAADLEKLAQRLLRGDAVDATATEVRRLLNGIVMLRKRNFHEVLMSFDGLIQQVAKRLEKDVAPLAVIGGDEIWIDPQIYQALLHALGHVFRNAVVHGIESPEGRWAAEKDEAGNITCHVAREDNTIKLSIADDGAGIDLHALRQRAAAAGIYSEQALHLVSDDEIVQLIFRDSVSTRPAVSELSGRGVGLSAVLSETRKLGGELSVKTVAGQGSEFLFVLPLPHCAQSALLFASHHALNEDIELVMQSIIAKTRAYFESELWIKVTDSCSGGGALESLILLDLTAMIGLGGRVGLRVVFSFQEGVVNAVYKKMTAGFDDHPDHVAKYREAAIGEVINTILGQCTVDLQHLDPQGIALTPPTIYGKGMTIPSENGTMFYAQGVTTAMGRLTISLVGTSEMFNKNSD